jgi:hypothetical protein
MIYSRGILLANLGDSCPFLEEKVLAILAQGQFVGISVKEIAKAVRKR